ncbi:hypothetical protein [Mangrovibacter sp. MFB070]|uniref:hypothetical protein n=1 Tax=Mangrovibacter sp. MFB070 TaxID=1224318 RepID=UPI001267C58D|nr:hypothetical protein [Mangrovibacter sp. MFB070]
MNQTYQKSCVEHRHQVMKEIRQFKSEIVRMLRATENHKLGNIRIEMPCADYPVLTVLVAGNIWQQYVMKLPWQVMMFFLPTQKAAMYRFLSTGEWL